MTVDPLDTPNGLIAKATKAKREGAAYIETTEDVAKYYFAEVPKEGYFMFQGIKCYIYGQKDFADKNDGLTIEDRLFAAP